MVEYLFEKELSHTHKINLELWQWTGLVKEAVYCAVTDKHLDRDYQFSLHKIIISEVSHQKDSTCNMFSERQFLTCCFGVEHLTILFRRWERHWQIDDLIKQLEQFFFFFFFLPHAMILRLRSKILFIFSKHTCVAKKLSFPNHTVLSQSFFLSSVKLCTHFLYKNKPNFFSPLIRKKAQHHYSQL